ncbi:PREDICTED: metalloproteinase inhibitor 4 [Chrysochloris asiatica]|uniref:Metalloproteinase inhibitor 4 n=1 Tax=Chrysochloris asiatica TaxID=185453 RepID=A0A9B0WYT2_CHRAS|nr:PREDICTED: metalloproteinase inhibitor 4 [Chrysochloris asiatica]
MPRGPWAAPGWALVLRLLALLRPPALSDACSCVPAHPQQHVCYSALVIRAKIASEKVVPASADPGDTQKMIRYEIKQIKMFKGFEKVKNVQYIYTPLDSSLCGVKLEVSSQKQYLLAGQVLNDGKVFVNLCNYIEPWENLSLLQRENLNPHHLNCDCRITTCYTVPCTISAPNECLWTDWLLQRKLYGYQAQHYVCVKLVDGTCSWHRGRLPLRKEFVGINHP